MNISRILFLYVFWCISFNSKTKAVQAIKGPENVLNFNYIRTMPNNSKTYNVFELEKKDQNSEISYLKIPLQFFTFEPSLLNIPYINKDDSTKKKSKLVITYSQVWHQYQVIRKHLNETRGAVRDSTLDFDGLVIDETQSKMGKDFYDLFYKKWDSPAHLLNYTIVIKEKPVPSLGTQIMVYIDEKKIFQSFLQPRYEVIEKAALSAVGYAENYLMITYKTKIK